MTLRRSIAFAWVMAAVLLMPLHSAMAKGGKGGGAAVVIDSVQFVDLPGGKKNIEILGGGLAGNDGLPLVTLDGVIELDVLEASATAISANVPKNTPDGDYSLMVSTGNLNKQNDALDIHLGGTISIVCIDWYLTTGPDNHIHVEGFLQDENGDPVIGAAVHWLSFVDGRQWYDYNTTTFKYAGYNHGESCPIEVAQASGATGQNCCIGSATDPPEDSRSCDSGFYEVEVISVQASPASDRKWDGITPVNGRWFVQP
ncbi:MAG: hypothetical protein JRG96_18285 [Deltaproteobacteria bacterium]|nr:hypothetical protein [Deltaproteobacteria bacterium]